MDKLKILVTGGAGFIGSNIADEYIKKGYDVTVIDDLSTGKFENLNEDAKFYKISLESPDLEKIFIKEKFDIINHHAAQIDVRHSVKNPVFDAKINVLGSLNLLTLAHKYNIKKIIYASTGGAIYGEPEYLPCDEKHPVRPLCPYGISKHTFEHYLEYYYDLYKLDYTVLRYANVYGPRQDPLGEAGVVAIFTNIILKDKEPIIYGDGLQTRDFVYIKDVVNANILSIEKGNNDIFNISTGIETSVNRIFQYIVNSADKNLKAVYEPKREGEVYKICLNNAKAKKILGWEPKYTVEEGIKETVEYYKSGDRI